MLTKQGCQIKEAMLLGAIRAARLSDDDKAVLKKEYKLPNDPNFKWRNAGRELAGANVGSLAGSLIGAGFGALKGPGGQAAGRLVGSAAGQVVGSWNATNKYSRNRAQQIRNRLKAKPRRV